MTQPSNDTNNAACQCTNKNCHNCQCGCGPACCSKDKTTASECPFIKAHPNWQKCPFMSKMFMSMCPSKCSSSPTATDTAAQIDHSTCDESKCANIPNAECTSCHKEPALNHTVTLATDTEVATDQTEEIVL